MYQLLTLHYAQKYVLTTLPIAHIQPFATEAIKELSFAVYALVIALVKIVYCVILIGTKLSILAFPHAVKIFRQIVKFHRTQLSWSDILIEISAISLILLYVIFRKRILDMWRRVDRYISAKSKAAAAAAPHVIFFTGALLFTVLGKKFILPFTSTTVMPLFTLGIPVLRSFRFARTFYNDPIQTNAHRRKYYNILAQLLTLWAVLGTYHSIVTVLALVPFSNKILSYLPYLKELIIVILTWIQLSPVFTKIVFSSAIAPVIAYLSKYIPTAQNGNAPDNNRHYVVMILRMSRFFKDHHLDFIGKLLEDSVVTIMATIFVCLPNPFATMGMMTITCLLPVFRIVTITNAFRVRGVGESTDAVIPMYLLDKALFWLYYWIAFAWLWLWRIYVAPVWPSVTILIALWLQHIFFAGGKYVVVSTIEATNVIIQRNQQRPVPRSISESGSSESISAEGVEDEPMADGGAQNDGNEVNDGEGADPQQGPDAASSLQRRLEQPSPSVENPPTAISVDDDYDAVHLDGDDDDANVGSRSVRRRNRLS